MLVQRGPGCADNIDVNHCAVPLTPSRGAGAVRADATLANWPVVLAACAALWLIMRTVFFVGLVGSDDLHYLRFAALWDRAPVNDWEARLIGNGLTALAVRLFGVNETAAALPSLAASLAVLACTLCWFRHYGTPLQGLVGGGIVALLPLDVEMATTVSPHTVMTGLFAVGTYGWFRGVDVARWRIPAAGFLALGVLTHFAGVYFVAMLALASLIVDRRAYFKSVGLTMLFGVTFLALDMIAFQAIYGDAFLRLSACMAEMHNPKPDLPMAGSTFTGEFLLWPLRNLVYSKAFGPALIVAMGIGVARFRLLDGRGRILLLVIGLTWLWMSFGTQVPWSYRPFWRMSRFLHPLALPVALLLAILLVPGQRVASREHTSSSRRWGPMVALGLSLTFITNLLASGPWGENVTTSRELLRYAKTHSAVPFITDYRTLNEMYALNGMRSPDNVVTLGDIPSSRLFDASARELTVTGIERATMVLLNPLNVENHPGVAALAADPRMRTVYETPAAKRRLCSILPLFGEQPWALRRPAGRVLRLE